MSSDGTNQRRLTSADLRGAPIRDLAWSANGKLAYVDHEDIFVALPEGGTPTNITHNSFHWSESGPAWSPDGGRMLFSARTDETSSEVFVMNADGSNMTNLTNNPADDIQPSWQR
jgi:TolB protein